MAAYVIRARRALIALVAALSLACGMLLVFKLGTPDAIVRLHTAELIAMLALFVLPWITLWAFGSEARAQSIAHGFAMSRRPSEAGDSAAAATHADISEADNIAPSTTAPAPATAGTPSPVMIVEHRADPRRTPAHRHSVDRRATPAR